MSEFNEKYPGSIENAATIEERIAVIVRSEAIILQGNPEV